MIPFVPDVAAYALGASVGALLLVGVGYWLGVQRAAGGSLEELEDVEGGHGFKMATQVTGSSGGVVDSYLSKREKQKALEKGFIRWHIVGSTLSEPMFVKPEREAGGNVPELEYEGDTYMFPEDCAVPAQEEGVPVFVHREGESDPIELGDGWDLAVDASTLTRYFTLRVTAGKPKGGMLGGLAGMDSMEIFRYGILGLIGLFIMIEVMSGGIV